MRSALPEQLLNVIDAYPGNDFLDALLVAFHVKEGLDLADSQIFPISQSNQFIECAEQFVCIADNLPLIQALAGAGDNLGEQMQRINVLENIGLTVGNEHHVKLVQGLVDKSNIVLLNGRMLRAAIGKAGE